MSIRAKFYLFYIAGITLVLSICLYAVNSYNAMTHESEFVAAQYSKQLMTAKDIEAHFNKQIYEWKNILIRGQDKEQFATHSAEFYEAERKTIELTSFLLENINKQASSHKHILSFKDNHEYIGELFLTAFSVINNSPVDAFQYADVVVMEIERQPRELIRQVITSLAEERQQAIAINTQQRRNWEYKIIALVVGSIFFVSLIFSSFIRRSVIKPLLELNQSARRLCEGDYETQVVIKNNPEAEEVGLALNRLSGSLKEYTSYMEDSLKQMTRLATEIADSNEQIKQKEARLKAIVDNMADGVITLGSDLSVEMFNPAAAKIFGYREEEIVERNIEALFDDFSKINIKHHEGPSLVQEVRGMRSDGRTFLMDCVVSEFCIDDISHYVLSVRDVTLRKLTEQKLVQLANYDSLTHLPNRNMLHSQLKNALELSSYRNTSLAVLHINVDHFKRINETFGYGVGDHLLKQIASRLKKCCANSDLVARLGGDEFAMIVDNVADANASTQVIERVLAMMEGSFTLSGHEIYADCSIGIAMYPHDASDVDDMLRQANIAVHHAKAHADRKYCYYSKDMDVCALEKLQMDGRIRQAVNKDEFLFYYQPQIDITTGQVVGAEALLRWNDPERGLIPPIDFIPLLEEGGMIIQLGESLLRKACGQGQIWHKAGYHNLTVSINLSARQFEDPNLLSMVRSVLEETQYNPRKLELEITESAIMGDAEKSEKILKALSEMGISVAIDDFGTGYSSLAYLRSFSLHTLKIDRSFVREIDARADDQAISQSIINMAHNLKMDVVAEGVETEHQVEVLKALGCKVVQGFYYSKPLTPEDMGQFLQKHNQNANSSEQVTSNQEHAVPL